MPLEKEMEKLIEANGASLYDTETVKENDETIYRVYVTKPGGVSLEDCVAITHDISPLLDVYPPVSGAYRLEVSSPGIERKLTKPSHFKNSVGEKIKAKILGGEKLKGTLKAADDEGIVIETKEEEEKRFGYGELGTVKTYFDF